MTLLTFTDIFEALTHHRTIQSPAPIRAAWIDSRQVTSGGLFFALPGERVDGHAFVSDAFRRGASAAVVNQDVETDYPVIDLRQPLLETADLPQPPFVLRVEDSLKAMQTIAHFWRRKHNLRVIGITGSVGKSSTKELIASVLGQRYTTLKNQGNFNNEIGLPLTLLGLNAEHQRAVLEMGFYTAGEISFLCDLALPAVGVVTNIGMVHAERVGSQDAIARGKAELVQALPSAPEGVAILNYDDARVRAMAAQTQARVFFYGTQPEADLWADQIESLGLQGMRCRLHYGAETIHMQTPLVGQHSAYTLLRAAAVGLAEGLSWEEIQAGVQSHVQLRLVTAHTPSGALLIDDTYNASPESTLAALNLLAEVEGRRIAVLGDMRELGPYEQAGHAAVGKRVAEVCDQLLAVGELAKQIAAAAVAAGMHEDAVDWVYSVPEASTRLHNRLAKGDVVLIKGAHSLSMERIVAALMEEAK